MDVNSVGQNSINYNNYQNSNVSDYGTSITEGVTKQVQKIETQSQEVSNNKQYDKKDVVNALNKLNNFLKDDKTHAEYTYNEEMKTMMVKIIDENTKEVVLEIPPKKILDMVASMLKQVGLLDKKA
ncbi:flagellar protein FlaG [Clostridium beijerinckii]|uniref:flagellar protein FlaG n=1 Tax=Clostridium beijerinckii TaxID=1520 RepID=UPI00232E77F9|nr:flagellar protein FlaG [Clostridium beijerinckii]